MALDAFPRNPHRFVSVFITFVNTRDVLPHSAVDTKPAAFLTRPFLHPVFACFPDDFRRFPWRKSGSLSP